MKHIINTLFCSLILIFANAQVGIGTSEPKALLDIQSSNQAAPLITDGILIPKIDTFPIEAPTAAQQGMLVYLTTIIEDNPSGFYFWDNIKMKWTPLGGKKNGWELDGNSGINPANSFFGTTDNVDLIFKRNNRQSGLINDKNTSFGYESLNANSIGQFNTANGTQALKHNTEGSSNSAFGANSLLNNTTGFQNTAMGTSALKTNTTGLYNTAYGYESITSNLNGDQNTASGAYSLQKNLNGNKNTANGVSALRYNVYGSSNTASGFEALMSNTTGNHNLANGASALLSNTSGHSNTAIGTSALKENINGFQNTSSGFAALKNNISGYNNTASGYYALFENTAGLNNTANGIYSLQNNTLGENNTASGFKSIKSNTEGSYNTALGYLALQHVTTGSNNTAIGANAKVPNATGSNQIMIGDDQITYAGTQVAWSLTSDKRLKKDIKPLHLGLDFIKELNPVSYIRKNNTSEKLEYGFIAQELEEVLNKSDTGKNGIITINDTGMYSVRYNDLLSPMVKAIQELEVKNITLKEQNELLELRLQAIEEKLSK